MADIAQPRPIHTVPNARDGGTFEVRIGYLLTPITNSPIIDLQVPPPSEWKHIYSCHKSYLAPKGSRCPPTRFAEFCFLCPEGHWSSSLDDWTRHCESHLTNLDTLPYQCDPLIYSNTLAAPGLCFWCLGNETLPPIVRLQQYLDKASWQTHIEKEHLAGSTACKTATCPHPRCTDPFASLEDRGFHLHDVHCWEPRKAKSGVKRRRACEEGECEEESEEKPRKRRRGTVRRVARPGTFEFVEQNSIYGSSSSPLSTSTAPSMGIDHPKLQGGTITPSSASWSLDTPPSSLMLTPNSLAIDQCSFHPDFVAALQQMELVPEDDVLTTTHGDSDAALALLELHARG